MSGKGGVGKTTVSVNIAQRLSKDHKVGILDADIHGPNVPNMLGKENEKLKVIDQKIIPVQVNENLSMVSVGFIVKENSSVIWRGPMKHNIIKQFTQDVAWKDLEYLIVDFPPGTGDECISATELLKDSKAIIVSTPQKVSIADSKRSIDFCKQMNLDIIGTIENMSGGMFGENTIKRISEELNVNFLGKIGMNNKIVESGDNGKIPEIEDFEIITKKIIDYF